ncbi:MAG: hypothetical protein J0H74_11875 [Chitinophagaceae bacterium]|nr:hypothetical protein [Chitinophagaceae bacterium]
MNKTLAVIALILAATTRTEAQQKYLTPAQKLMITSEDSLNNNAAKNKTVISGYGSAFYQRDFNTKQSSITLERAVLFVGHQFNEKIAFFSELELENAKIAAGEGGKGEIAMEQAYLKFNLNAKQYLVAGLFVPRIGLLNENHLPINFNGVERPIVEQVVIPATWRELGVGFYGSLDRLPVNYSVALVNGLNSAGFEHGTGIMGGRAEGSTALANNLALTASLQYLWNNFKFQISGYMGGTVGLSKRSADSLNVGLQTGAFGTPLYLGEFDVQYGSGGFTAKALATYISYPDADKIYRAYGKNVPAGMYGSYLEFAYDWLYHRQKTPQFITFARLEALDLNSKMSSIQKTQDQYDGTLKQTHIIAGIGYLPIPNVVIKADIRILHTGEQNPALVINPPPNALAYKQNNQLLNIGIGYSF